MHLLKTGQIANCCQPNALMTLKEFLMDYASEETQAKGDEIIAKRLAMIPNEKVREIATERLGLIEKGTRDFRF
jgi:2-iminoacetate synthase